MEIKNVGLFVKDLEAAKKFFEDYFDMKVHCVYNEEEKGFYSYIMKFDTGAKIELMTKPEIVDDKKEEIPSINDNQESNEFDKISEDEFKKALEDIEKLEKQNNIENIKSDELKDFWG